MHILAADIGGTNCRLAYFDTSKNAREAQNIQVFASADYSGFEAAAGSYLELTGFKPESVSVAVAGPVFDSKCEATNLPWKLDSDLISAALDVPRPRVHLLNDLAAQGYGIETLPPAQTTALRQGVQRAGNKAVIAAGTGLGECILYWDGRKHRAFATEGGHSCFAARTEAQLGLLQYLLKSHHHVSCERVVSGGLGLPNIYRYFQDQGMQCEVEVGEDDDNFGVKLTAAARQGCPTASASLNLFLDAYGGEAGNLALKSLAVGGIYLAGGIAPSLEQELRTGPFLEGFDCKGRFRSLMNNIPILIIKDPQNGLAGAVNFALMEST